VKLCDMGDYEIHVPTSGGKAGKGHNATSTIQVRRNSLIVKSVRFSLADASERSKAIQKAMDWIGGNK
jgi:hypothetical protein